MADVTIPSLPVKGTPVITDLLEISANPGSFHITLGSLSAIYQPINEKGVANGYASLDGSTLVPVAQIPALNVLTAPTGAVDINSQNLNNILNADVEGFIDIAEIPSPANPAANIGRLYVKDVAAITTLFFRDFAGNDTNISTPAVTIDDLTDVTITTRAANEVLVVNGGNTLWVNALLVNANVDASAAIAYSKLNLTGLVVNADLTSGVFGAITGIGTQSQALDLNNNNLVNAGDINTDGFIDFNEIATPANPAADVGRLYVKDNATATQLFFRDSAGLELNLSVPVTTLEDLTDTTITAAAAHEVLVRNAGNTAWVNELLDNDNLASGTFNNITGLPGVVTFETIDTPPVLTLTPNRSTPATGTIGDLIWSDNDSIPSTQEFARIRVVSSNITSGAEEGSMSIRVVEGGTEENYLALNSSGFSGEILVLKPINMLDDAIIFTNDTSNPPSNSLKWIAHEFGVLWYNSDNQHDFAVSGTSLATVKILSTVNTLDLKNTTQLFGALRVQFGNSATLPDSFLRYIQYGTVPGFLINAAAGDTTHLTFDAVEEFSFNATVADFHGNTLTNVAIFESNATNVSSVGNLRFGDLEVIGFRNSTNDGDFTITSDDPTITFGGWETIEFPEATIIDAGSADFQVLTIDMSGDMTLNSNTINTIGNLTFDDGARITFNPNATNAGINVGAHTADPSALVNGDIWYESTANTLSARINGVTVDLGAGGGETFTWTADHSAARFNLENTGAIDFSLSGPLATPASTQPYITYDVGPVPDAMRINVPLSRDIFISMGAVDQYHFDTNAFDMLGNTLDNVAIYNSNATNPGSLGAIRLGNDEKVVWRNAANSANNLIEFNTADEFVISITNGDDYSFSETQFDVGQNQLLNASALGMTAAGATLGAAVNNIFGNASGMTFNTLAADSFFYTINGTLEYTFNRDEIIFGEGNDMEFGTTTGTIIGTATTQKLSFYAATPIIRPTALTTALTTLTNAGTASDFAIQVMINASAWGFANQAEGETVVEVVLNNQARINELETKLQALGLIA